MLKNNGYTVYTSKTSDGEMSHEQRGYIFAISPSDNVLYVQRGYFGGWEISLQYVPSRKNGSGCRDNSNQPYGALTLEVIQQAERNALAFARNLHATLYPSSAVWVKGYWAELVQL